MSWLVRFIGHLHSRPRHERLVLAGITYVTAAVVVIAFWVTSLKTTLNFETPANPAPAAAPPPKLAETPLAKPELATPLESLREAVGSPFERAPQDLPRWFSAAIEVLRYNLDLLKDGFISFYRYWAE